MDACRKNDEYKKPDVIYRYEEDYIVLLFQRLNRVAPVEAISGSRQKLQQANHAHVYSI